ncbi:alkylhydroperoxidase AhpD family core domain-containing protein [Reichenbachiella faecimaris]|uniref:Alkylhydroperoxidase AhpD family core domain-containing protein n=1 Tax=Reichenbachiella faecimaris TaxID=692418 RepID=A0A1W2GKL3_REIFA|nr:carboxymuconolactone decarboxylase family protein [Reichenbachiella faecimaris]SMD37111.1 alkylhydroperoxidase AhpD family core domain-containing protein [Reichenbachiella faecimaris]
MESFEVPAREEVSANNQAIFDDLKNKVGFVPNLYATYTHSENALADYLTLSGRKTSLSGKEKEVVNLVVSEVNNCNYCKAAHTAIGKMNGFSDDEILEIRSGEVSFDSKLDALAKYVKSAVVNRSKPEQSAIDAFFSVGYTKENLVDTVLLIGDKTISNFLHGSTQIPVDFPAVQELEAATL